MREFTATAIIDDPEVEEIKIIVKVKDEIRPSSTVLERAASKWLVSQLQKGGWVEHCAKHSIKTL